MLWIFNIAKEKRTFYCNFLGKCNSYWRPGRLLTTCLSHREKERLEGQRTAKSLQSAPPLSTKQQQHQDAERLYKEQNIQTIVHMRNLKVGTCIMCVGVWASCTVYVPTFWVSWVTITTGPACFHVFVVMLQCLQRHFSGWYSVVLDRRLRMGKAMALWDWKKQLRAWRAWRAVVWAEQKQREVTRTEEALRAENRQEKKKIYYEESC